MEDGMTLRTEAAGWPVPGVLHGSYPMRVTAPPRRTWAGTGRMRRAAAATVAAVRVQQARWRALDELAQRGHLLRLRPLLARDGVDGRLRQRALGAVCAVVERVLGRDPYDTQILCADALLDDRFAEMATGEGKTLAAALAGVPVHVMTANDYLAARDAAQLAPLYAALGLRVGTVLATTPPAARRVAYAADITYATAREIAFDHLRDGAVLQARGSELQHRAACLGAEPVDPAAATAPLLRGLCLAIVDEADSLLIDEATLPLVLAEPHDDPAHRAACFQALMLARRLQPGRDAEIDATTLSARWTEAGTARLEQHAAGLGGAWLNRHHRQELVGAALVALHALMPDQHYLVRDGRIELLDAVTGRTAPGRVWARGLQTLVELKEGCPVSAATRTCAQLSVQGFFGRYLRLSGISGTLTECRVELAAVHGRAVVTVPLRRPARRQVGPARLFADAAARAQAVPARVAELLAAGRPVLIGTDDVAAAAEIAARLQAAGIAHAVLDARHDADEATIVAQAGQAGTVTVATRMAGRGTDIVLGPGVAERGGLHVLCCQDNASARADRQLVGRAARQGDPGSAEHWHALDAPVWQAAREAAGISGLADISVRLLRGRQPDARGVLALPPALVRVWCRWHQQVLQRQARRQRQRLAEQDRTWQAQLDFHHLHA
jgi:preprotein translocase subunit SecA